MDEMIYFHTYCVYYAFITAKHESFIPSHKIEDLVLLEHMMISRFEIGYIGDFYDSRTVIHVGLSMSEW